MGARVAVIFVSCLLKGNEIGLAKDLSVAPLTEESTNAVNRLMRDRWRKEYIG